MEREFLPPTTDEIFQYLESEIERLRQQIREMEEAPLNQLRRQRDELADALLALMRAISYSRFGTEVPDALRVELTNGEIALRNAGRLKG